MLFAVSDPRKWTMKVKYPKNEIGSLTQEKNKTEKPLRNQPSVGAEVRLKKEKGSLIK